MFDAPTRTLNAQQYEAAHTLDQNVVVVAGAGTGKTTVLVDRFVALLEANPDWPVSAIVAITFTNRAADEMRARVRDALQRRLAASSGEERRHWAAHLAGIGAARISTIHTLCAEIVRANAARVSVDPGFRVADATEAALLREDAVEAALALAVNNEVLTPEDRAYALEVLARYSDYEISDSLKDAGRLDTAFGPVRDLDSLNADWESRSKQALHDLCTAPEWTAFDQFIMPSDAAPWQREAIDVIRSHLPALAAGNSSRIAQAMMTVAAIRSENRGPRELSSAIRAVRELCRRTLQRTGCPPDEQDGIAADLLRGWMALIALTHKTYADLKNQKNVLDFDDLESMAAMLLRDGDIATRYAGTEFLHVMVDEFQDTNLRQWEIVRALAPPEQAGSLFIVGDPKQSIYAFRGADVTVFDLARREIERNGGMTLPLQESYRAHSGLVEQFNALFSAALTCPPDAINPAVYVTFDETQRLASTRQPPEGSPVMRVLAVNRPDRGTRQRALDIEARVVAQQIRRLVDGELGVLVFDWEGNAYRAPKYGDVALLLRAFNHKLEAFERALQAEGVPYITMGGQGFYGRREVRDLINALHALHTPGNELKLAATLHSPLFALSDAVLARLRLHGLPLIDALHAEAEARRSGQAYEPVVFASDALKLLAPKVGRTPVEMLLQELIHVTGYMATLAGLPGGQQMRANVEKLIDRARDSGLSALNQFLRYLRDMTEAEAKEGGVPLEAEDAVRVTTIHSAKGLEYPVVWIADADEKHNRGGWQMLNAVDDQGKDRRPQGAAERRYDLGCVLPKPDQADHPAAKNGKLHPYVYRMNAALLDEREDAESLRLLYVAATRARDALFVSGVVKDKDGRLDGWLSLCGGHCEPEIIAPAAGRPPRAAEPAPTPHGEIDFPLARTIPAARLPDRLHLSVSDITTAGGLLNARDAEMKARYDQRLRGRLLDDDSAPLELLTYDAEGEREVARRIGTLVHDALRFGYDALLDRDEERADALITSMAWELGITQPNQLERALERVKSRLMAYRRSALCREVEQAKAVYREMPFTYQRDGHVIYGMIDLLYRSPDGTWTVVDYKTDYVEDCSADGLKQHARMYHLQMAIYSEAVAAQFRHTPRAMLVFLGCRDGALVLNPAELRAELQRVPLDRLIQLLEEAAS